MGPCHTWSWWSPQTEKVVEEFRPSESYENDALELFGPEIAVAASELLYVELFDNPAVIWEDGNMGRKHAGFPMFPRLIDRMSSCRAELGGKSKSKTRSARRHRPPSDLNTAGD